MTRDECEHGQLRRSCEICELHAEAEEQSRLIEKQSALLHDIAASLKGMRGDGRHNLADLPRLAKAIIDERDALRQRIDSAPVAEVSLDERGCPTISCDLEEGQRVRLVVDEG